MKINLRYLITAYLIWFAIVLFVLMQGCSPILRHNRLVKKFPYVHTSDTLVLRDTITFKEVHHDSSFYYKSNDTIVINKDNLEIKYFYSNDTVHIDGRCKEVKTIIERKVPVYKNNTDYVALFKRWFWWIFGIVALLIGIRLVIKLYFKK